MTLWDPQQREWLEAMGHSLLVLADARDAEVAPVDAVPVEAPPLDAPPIDAVDPAAKAPADQPTTARRPDIPSPATAPLTRENLAQTAPTPARPKTDRAAKAAALQAARADASRQLDGPLRQALLRATGQMPAVAARTLRELDIDAGLRDDPSAKRALWARLRALRKAARG